MDQRVSLRRSIVPALLAGLTLCGTLAVSSVALADGNNARVDARISALGARSASGAPRTALRTNVSHPSMAASSHAPQASTAASRTATTRASSGTGVPEKSASAHLNAGAAPAKIAFPGIAASTGR